MAHDILLQIGSNTLLVVAGSPGANPTLASPSVGSKITAFGTKAAATSATASPTFDATAGLLRLEVTSLWGVVDAGGIGNGTVTVNLQAIEGLGVGAFDFTGTGSDPANYVVATGALPLSNTAATAALRFFGFVQPFGSAPPDFNAETLVNFTDTSAVLEAGFGAGSSAALSVSGTTITLNVSDPALGWLHFLRIGPQLIDLTKLGSNLAIVPDAASNGPFMIRSGAKSASSSAGWESSVTVYNSAADFLAALGNDLQMSGAKVEQVLAVGKYDATANALTAEQMIVNLD